MRTMKSLCVLNEKSRYSDYKLKFKSGIEFTEYQKATLSKMLSREETYQITSNNLILHTNMGILSNKVGTGKTIITLGLIKYKNLISKKYNTCNYMQKVCYKMYPKLPKDITNLIGEYSSDFHYQAFTYSPYTYYSHNVLECNTSHNYQKSTDIQIQTNLIVVSHSLFHQWKNEISKHTNLKVKYISSKRHINFTKEDIRNGFLNKYDIVLCTSNKLSNIYECSFIKFCSLWTSKNNEYVWSRVFVDEADTITSSCNNYFPYLRSHFLWIITASYEQLLKFQRNNFITNSIRTLCKNTNEKIIGTLTITCDSNFIQKSLNLKPIKYTFKFFDNNFLYYFFHKLKNDKLNNCLNSDNYLGALDIIMSNHKTYLNKYALGYLGKSDKKRNMFYKNNLIIIYFLQLIHKFIKLKNRINKINSKRKIDEEKLQYYIKLLLNMGNQFHYYKLLISKNRFCVMCYKHNLSETLINNNNFMCSECKQKTEFESFNFSQIDEIIIETFNGIDKKYSHLYFQHLNKRKKLDIEIIKNFEVENIKISHIINELKTSEKRNKRFLIFTNNYFLIYTITKQFEENNIIFTILKGNNNTINKRLQDYNNKKIQVLLLNAKYFANGLNLQHTDEIYIFNNLTHDMEKQVIGRANRFGRKKELIVNYVLYENEKHYVYDKIKQRDASFNI